VLRVFNEISSFRFSLLLPSAYPLVIILNVSEWLDISLISDISPRYKLEILMRFLIFLDLNTSLTKVKSKSPSKWSCTSKNIKSIVDIRNIFYKSPVLFPSMKAPWEEANV